MSCRAASRGRALQDAVRHDAVRAARRSTRWSITLRRGDGAGDARGVPLPAELARDADPDAGRAGERHRHVPRPARCSGFSINVLTLFGLVLAIGIVVDDAIVVIENVERIMAERGPPAAAGGGPGDPPGGRRAGRDRAGALCRVRAGRVHRRRDRRDVQAVRDDDRDRGRAVGRRRADAHAGALRAAAQGVERGDTRRASSAGSTACSRA